MTSEERRRHYFTPTLLFFVVFLVIVTVLRRNRFRLSHASTWNQRKTSEQEFVDALDTFSTIEQEYGPLSTSRAPLDSFVNIGTNDWMLHLDKSTPLSLVAIPGTHDSGANVGGIFCQTQYWSIADQLRAGIRYLDIRCRRSGNRFAIHHGICFLNQFFEDVIQTVHSFLENHPSETIIMRIKEEHNPTHNALSFEDIWNRYMNEEFGFSELFLKNLTGIPTLVNARGRIVVLSDEEGPRPEYGLSWSDRRYTDIQDQFEVNSPHALAEKTELVFSYMEKASQQPQKFTINHLSASGVPKPDYFPLDIAGTTNVAAYRLIGTVGGKRLMGLLFMDYPGEALIARIIKSNFGDPILTPLRTRDQFSIFDQTGCTGEVVGVLDYPGPGGAIELDSSASKEVVDDAAQSILLDGPISAGTRILLGGAKQSFGESDNTVITVLVDVWSTDSICIKDLRQKTVMNATYEQHYESYPFKTNHPTSFLVETPSVQNQNFYLSVANQLQWTPRVHGAASSQLQGPIVGLYCSKDKCKRRTLLQSDSGTCASDQFYWTGHRISECKPGHFVGQMKCSIFGCRFMKNLRCMQTSSQCQLEERSSLRQVHWNEEKLCPVGSVVTGIQCHGKFLICHTIAVYCSKLNLVA